MQYIIYHDKSHEAVDDKIANLIWEKSTSGLKGSEINGKKYIFSSIAKILPEEDYFKQYPDKRPEVTYNQFEDLYGAEGNQQIRQPTTRARELMKGGFIGYHLSQGKTPEEAKKKFDDFIKAGLDYKISKHLKYA